MKPFILTLLLAVYIPFPASAYDKRDLLQQKASLQQVRSALLEPSEWVPYPAYSDRRAWEQLTDPFREEQLKVGERYLDYEWKVIRLTDYLDYSRTGARTTMQDPFGSNCNALSALVLAELCEGKGRFIDQIANGVWMFTEMTSWVLSAHLSSAQSSKLAIPDFREQGIDLTSGDMGSFMAWVYYFFKEPFDQINPLIAERIKVNIQDRILTPFRERSDFWWQAFQLKPGGMVNNWNPWCNFNVLTCFLLMETDPDKRAAGVYRAMVSTDEFINYTHADGACEEGPSYWGHAAGKLYDFLQILSYASNGTLSVFQEPIIKNMGEYIANSYIGNGWVVNFADASARGGGDAGVIFRYGKAVNSPVMQRFAAYLNNRRPERVIRAGRDLFRALEDFRYTPQLQEQQPALPAFKAVWYPETEFCYLKNDNGFFFAAKGGNNAESHNHNDIGTFSLYIDATPVFIDAGVGTYTRETFSSARYTIWTMQSDYHNLPKINNASQAAGAAYRSRNVTFDEKKPMLSMDISGAYPEQAGVREWRRSYTFNKKGEFVLDDAFTLHNATAPNQVNFMVSEQPDISQPGIVQLKAGDKQVKLRYDAAQLAPEIETVPQPDPRLSNVWGKALYRITFNARKLAQKGHYQFIVTTE